MSQGTTDAGGVREASDDHAQERFAMARELKDSALLFGMTLSTMGAYLALGAGVVRLLTHR